MAVPVSVAVEVRPIIALVVVVAAHGVMGMAADPLDTGPGLQAIIDQVAQKQAHIVRLVDGLQRGEIGMDVGEQQGSAKAPRNIEKLNECAWRTRRALEREGITGEGGQEIDHIELSAPSERDGVDSRNFVLCPGKAYDRSPCGTGTSAKLACLYADGKLKDGEVWRQESIVGSVFEGAIFKVDGRLYPTIKGSAFVNSEADLILDERDPFCYGIRQ